MNAVHRSDRATNCLHQQRTTVLAAIEAVLREANRSLHSREIAEAISEHHLAKLSGATPWKTVNARVSMDIRANGSASRFMRTAHGLFALREWDFATEFEVKRRRIAPIDEVIRVTPRFVFDQLEKYAKRNPLLQVDYADLVAASIDMPRRDAEETEDYVQLIPTFVVRCKDRIWTYTRTRRLPEARLHCARCVSFGGHMQSDDDMPLFRDSVFYRDSVLRELYEELAFSADPSITYLGVIHLHANMFERQHAGLVFEVSVQPRTRVASLEPGMHTDVRPTAISDLRDLAPELDSWSQLLIKVVDGPG